MGTDVTGRNFFLFFVRHALIRTLHGSAFDPVHARVRRGCCYLRRELLVGAKRSSGSSLGSQSPDGTSKNTVKSSWSVTSSSIVPCTQRCCYLSSFALPFLILMIKRVIIRIGLPQMVH